MANYNTNLNNWGASGSAPPSGYKYEVDTPPVDAYDNWAMDNTISDIKHLIGLTNSRIESDSGGAGGEPGSPETSHLYYDEGNERLEAYDASASTWRELMRVGGDTMQGELSMGGYNITSAYDIYSETDGRVLLRSSGSNGELGFYDGSSSTWTIRQHNSGDLEFDAQGSVYSKSSLYQNGSRVANRNWVNNNADVPNADYADSAGDANTLDGNDSSYFTTLTEVNNNADVPNADYADNAGYANNAGDADTVDGKEASGLTAAPLPTPNSISVEYRDTDFYNYTTDYSTSTQDTWETFATVDIDYTGVYTTAMEMTANLGGIDTDNNYVELGILFSDNNRHKVSAVDQRDGESASGSTHTDTESGYYAFDYEVETVDLQFRTNTDGSTSTFKSVYIYPNKTEADIQ